ncbi:MAG: NADAR family protein [Gammaproteobacteria bacterium]|nr:NADAR family protein [Gammaproteobacteria bacterium]MDD9863687.1 NADAR family protein [Gammaproteobacteria bacterium]
MSLSQERQYSRPDSVIFHKTRERFGGLSNMAGGFPLRVNGVRILTSEALYQACRFPKMPKVQKEIIAQKSPMTAKMKSKPHRVNSRRDWERVRVEVMRWCLQVKLIQNWEKFSGLLRETGDRNIVEYSRKDDFWGAKPADDNTLVGKNVLGRLLMELRKNALGGSFTSSQTASPPEIDDFLLYNEPIRPVVADIAPVMVETTSIPRQMELFSA